MINSQISLKINLITLFVTFDNYVKYFKNGKKIGKQANLNRIVKRVAMVTYYICLREILDLWSKVNVIKHVATHAP